MMNITEGSGIDPNSLLIVVDFEEHTRGGHFSHLLRLFSTEFSKRAAHVVIYTPNPDRTREVFFTRAESNPAPPNISFIKTPVLWRRYLLFFGPRKRCLLDHVTADAAKRFPGNNIGAFVMWGYDLVEERIGTDPLGIPWATYGQFSWHLRKYKTHKAGQERDLLKLCQDRPDCVAVMANDDFAIDEKFSKAIWIPSPEDLQLPEVAPAEADALKNLAAGRPIIGGLGMLNGERCVNEIIRLALKHPEFCFLLAGSLARDSVDPTLVKYLEGQRPPNLMVIPEFLTELRLNGLVNACDAVYLDGVNYPVVSAIACKALYFCKFLLTRKSNSWMNDVINKWDVGIAYEGEEPNFIAAWEKWKSNGGPARSRKAGEACADVNAFRQCFDKTASRLLDFAKKSRNQNH